MNRFDGDGTFALQTQLMDRERVEDPLALHTSLIAVFLNDERREKLMALSESERSDLMTKLGAVTDALLAVNNSSGEHFEGVGVVYKSIMMPAMPEPPWELRCNPRSVLGRGAERKVMFAPGAARLRSSNQSVADDREPVRRRRARCERPARREHVGKPSGAR